MHGVRAQFGKRLQLGLGLAELERLLEANRRRHDLAHQRVERIDAERREHLALRDLVGSEVPAGELLLAQEIGEIAHTPADFA